MEKMEPIFNAVCYSLRYSLNGKTGKCSINEELKSELSDNSFSKLNRKLIFMKKNLESSVILSIRF